MQGWWANPGGAWAAHDCWFLNRKKDYTDGRFSQVVSNALDMKLRDDLERLKKIRLLFQHILVLDYCYVKPLSIHTTILGEDIVEH
jgi:hypothetical protein